jgi:hypothetical protein
MTQSQLNALKSEHPWWNDAEVYGCASYAQLSAVLSEAESAWNAPFVVKLISQVKANSQLFKERYNGDTSIQEEIDIGVMGGYSFNYQSGDVPSYGNAYVGMFDTTCGCADFAEARAACYNVKGYTTRLQRTTDHEWCEVYYNGKWINTENTHF